jgi:hypothetical protein
VEKRLRKLPLCRFALAEVTESIEDFQYRRIVWAAEVLRRQEQPIQVWRLRRLAALRDQCAPKVEKLLVKTANGM